MPDFSPEALDRDQAICDAATAGPWGWCSEDVMFESESVTVPGEPPFTCDEYAFVEWSPRNTDFIAHARTRLPEYIAEVRRLREQVAKVRDKCSQYVNAHGLTDAEVHAALGMILHFTRDAE